MLSVTTQTPRIYLARHGETQWSKTGQHTGLTDLPLTARGEENARQLGKQIDRVKFPRVLCSPLLRARRTCELAGYGNQATIDDDLVEWNYGEYEGITTADIQKQRPDWQLFRDGCPGGESPANVARRADGLIERLRSFGCDVLVFSSGHFLRMVAARWLGMEPVAGRYFHLSTATLSILGYEHNLNEPVIRLRNDDRHVGERTGGVPVCTRKSRVRMCW
jgi:probable phosphoglycerate mutase